ncbi:MAG: DUF2845 domain-containing protein [Gammaproteobacteria bacterium]
MKYLALISFCILLVSEPAWALKCGNKIVRIGDRLHRVHRLCGDPAYVHAYDQPIGVQGYQQGSDYYYYYQQGSNHIDVWTYNFGPSRFMRELIFENGVLRYINQLDYGY